MTGNELDTQVRTVSKMLPMLEEAGLTSLVEFVKTNDLVSINRLVQQKFTGKPEFNTGSPKQMQQFLYETLGLPVRLRNIPTPIMRKAGKDGTARTDEDAMNMAIKFGDVNEADVPIVKGLIELKSIGTRTGLYWKPYPKLLHWKTGLLHPELRQSATNTRRYAGSSPNIQQLDSSPMGIRSCILPHKRNAVIVSLDESAQEVRQLADYSLDPDLLTCYLGTKEQLRDVHSLVACRIMDCTYEEFRRLLTIEDAQEKGLPTPYKEARQKAKITLFATLYGAGAPKIAEGLGITEKEAQAYIDAIYAQFPKTKQWKEESEQYARINGSVPIHGGTIRHLNSLIYSDDKYTASKALRQAGNARIQSAGGNQIKRVMSRIWDSDIIERFDYRWYFSVHDETVHSVGDRDVSACVPILHGFMTEQFLNVVPSASSIGLGKNFGELTEIGEIYSDEKVQAALNKLFNKEPEFVSTN
jgi:DNA polymerase-1